MATFNLMDLTMKTHYMMEHIRRRAIDDTLEKFKVAARNYYTQGYDNGETVKLVKELEELGANMDMVAELDIDIMCEVEGIE